MKLSMLTVLMVLLSFGSVCAQNVDHAEETLVMNYLRDANPDAEDINWMRVEGTDRIRITFVEDDVKQYALVSTEAIEYETGALIDEDDLPDPTDAAFLDTKYGEWDVLGIYLAETPRQGEMYRFDVSIDDADMVTLYFNELGEQLTINHNVNPAR